MRDLFLTEFDEANALELPAGYAFRPTADAPVTPPNLMQGRVAVCVRNGRRFGNWSGGANPDPTQALERWTASARQ